MNRMQRSGSLANPLWILFGSLAVAGLLVYLLWSPTHPTTQKEDLTLFCAAGLLQPVAEVAGQYEQATGVKIRIEPDASGSLLSKLRVAPEHVDLFLSGEHSFLQSARDDGLVAEILPVARQHAVIAVAAGNPLAIAKIDDLLGEKVRVALPNPEATAVGRTAQRALAGTGQWAALEKQLREFRAKVSTVGKVTEAAQAVKVGTADAAIVWDSTARQFGLSAIEVPAFQDQPPELAEVGVVSRSPRPTAALHFARFLTAADRGEPVFQKHFYQPIADADAWADRPALVFMAGAMLKPAVDDLLKAFSQREGVDINTIYNGCGIHVAQMKAMKSNALSGQHFPDAYFSCDVSFMNNVQQWFEASRTISRNDMVLAVAKGNPLQVHALADLARPELRIGLGHPTNSALGGLTESLLQKLQLRDKVYTDQRKTPILHTDAGHVLVNQLRVGALDAIIVYRSNVLAAGAEGARSIELVDMNIPEAVAIQPYAVSKDSQHKQLMRRLLDAILAPASRDHFQKSGFQWLEPKAAS